MLPDNIAAPAYQGEEFYISRIRHFMRILATEGQGATVTEPSNLPTQGKAADLRDIARYLAQYVQTETEVAAEGSAQTTVRAATTANITIGTALNNGDSLDGVTLATGDLVLVKNQSTASQNGIYVVGDTPTRDERYDAFDEYPGLLVTVQEGSVGAETVWLCVSNKGGTLGATAISFIRYAALSAGIAYVSSAGVDASAVVGDPIRPFLTLQGAYNAGAKYFIFGIGSFGDLTLVADEVLWFVGYGSWKDYEADGAAPASLVGTINCGQFGLLLQDVHGYSVYVTAISALGSAGATGDTDSPGANGGDTGTTIALRRLEVGGITVSGGAGGAGGPLDVATGTVGGNGGVAGYLALDETRVFGAISVTGGAGGAGVGDGAGGNGGANLGGEISHRTETLGIAFRGGPGGSGSPSGNGGNSGGLTITRSGVATVDMAGGTGSAPGTNGTVSASESSLITPTNTSTYTRVAVVEGGVFQAS